MEVKEQAGPASTVLLLEDDERLRVRLGRAFSDRGWRVVGAATCAEAARVAEEELLDLAIVDLRLGEESGIKAVGAIRAGDGQTVILVVTGYGSIVTAVAAVKAGASDYLTKPTDAEQLVAAYERVRAGMEGAVPETTVPSLGQVEWEHIHRVLEDCGGNITRAAKMLGLHRRSLQRKLGKRPLPAG